MTNILTCGSVKQSKENYVWRAWKEPNLKISSIIIAFGPKVATVEQVMCFVFTYKTSQSKTTQCIATCAYELSVNKTQMMCKKQKMLTETLFKIPLSVIGRCSLVPTSYWLQGKCARINLSQAAPGIILQNHRRPPVSSFSVKIAILGSSKWVTGRIFKMSK